MAIGNTCLPEQRQYPFPAAFPFLQERFMNGFGSVALVVAHDCFYGLILCADDEVHVVSHLAPGKDLQAFGYSAVAEAFNNDVAVGGSVKISAQPTVALVAKCGRVWSRTLLFSCS